ncbi:oxygenase MpaB family protein [Adhaeribacter terreus]|uniref:Oxygenase MpaB family protein n=1 Tax=Adhaeribacter terreus TaxID=529703 RepID=A0ABW0EH04_9BACT
MEYFVKEDSVVRQIWGTSDIILFIFAGAAAEFALNKAVDWLYFTGKLPQDPLGRLFSTVEYARVIVFSEKQAAEKAIDTMAKIHAGVEHKRGEKIPDWAYRDVLFMLIDYSIRSFELLDRRLTPTEKEEVFDVFNRVGLRMGLQGLPQTFPQWQAMRAEHLRQNLKSSRYTADLFQQYKKHLGNIRYNILLQAQLLVIPKRVRKLLDIGKVSVLLPAVPIYRITRKLNLDWILKALLLPAKYKGQIHALDRPPGKLSFG